MYCPVAYPGGFSGCPETPPPAMIFLIRGFTSLHARTFTSHLNLRLLETPLETNSGYATAVYCSCTAGALCWNPLTLRSNAGSSVGERNEGLHTDSLKTTLTSCNCSRRELVNNFTLFELAKVTYTLFNCR